MECKHNWEAITDTCDIYGNGSATWECTKCRSQKHLQRRDRFNEPPHAPAIDRASEGIVEAPVAAPEQWQEVNDILVKAFLRVRKECQAAKQEACQWEMRLRETERKMGHRIRILELELEIARAHAELVELTGQEAKDE